MKKRKNSNGKVIFICFPSVEGKLMKKAAGETSSVWKTEGKLRKSLANPVLVEGKRREKRGETYEKAEENL